MLDKPRTLRLASTAALTSTRYRVIVGVLANRALADDAVISFPKVTTACCRETYA